MSVQRLILFALAILAACSAAYPAQSLFVGDEKVPANAVVLFDGKDLSQWVGSGGSPAPWKLQDGYMVANGGDIRSKREFGDCQIHVEFWLPNMSPATGQARANSGVYVADSYEVQVLDSYGLDSKDNDCGAIYSFAAPTVNACRPPEQWQTYDILFKAARFDESGKKTSDAVMSVMQNGVWIHNCLDVPHKTPGGVDDPKTGPIRLQDHGCPIRFRNIWVIPLEQAK
jgi:hypothetical protein